MRDGWEPYHERMGKIDEEFMATHPDSYVTAQILRYKTSSMSYGEAQAAYEDVYKRQIIFPVTVISVEACPVIGKSTIC